jgi:endonuclease V-like protein UPF0215 family
MTTLLTHVKDEVRILGLDRCNPRVTIGAVVRGGLYLDGIIVFPKKHTTAQLTNRIRETKYFPELRLIMIHGFTRDLNSATIERISRLPVIRVSRGTQTKRGTFQGNEFGLSVKTKLDRPTLRRILTLTQVLGPLPEPVRVAHLLAKLHISGKISRDKG